MGNPTLGINAGDYLDTSVRLGAEGQPELVSAVSAASVVDEQNTYEVTVPSGVYTCSPSDTVVSAIKNNGKDIYVIGERTTFVPA